MRPLTLHASALNDDEYSLYTSSIIDLALYDSNHSDNCPPRDDTFYEQITVSVRESRAWLRGRYPNIQVSAIDAILKLFAPTLSQADTISGGQFFAALRLVVHVQNGSDVDRSLAFVQARPPSTANNPTVTKSPPNAGLPRLPRRSEDSSAPSSIPEPGPSQANPFSYESGPHPPLHPSQRQDSIKAVLSPNNPFISRSKSTSLRSEDGSPKIPPLPPRKPSSLNSPPPRHTPISTPQVTRLPPHPPHANRTSTSSAPQPPPSAHPPPPPPKTKPVGHITSTLMKQSLQASKTAQTMKKAEEQLEKERVLQVLRSSAVVSGAHVRPPTFSSGSRSPSKRVPTPPGSMTVAGSSVVAKSDSSASWSDSEEREQERPPLPRRRNQPQQPSPPMSTSSFEQVALAAPPSGGRSHPHSPYVSSPFESPTHSPRRHTSDLPGVAGLPPPTHPDRKHINLSHHLSPTQVEDVSPTSSVSPFVRNLESFEAVYGTAEPSTTMSSLSTDTPTTPTPPTSASDVFTSGSSSQQRVYRSKSLHYHPPPNLPPPPPTRRKRPESMQVLPNGEMLYGSSTSSVPKSASAATSSLTFDSNNALKNSMSQVPSFHRRSSHSSSFGGSASSSTALGTGASGNGLPGTSGSTSGSDIIQRRIAELQLRAENAIPVLEKARYKAEAGLSRRGFIQGSGSSNLPSGGRSHSRGTTMSNGREDREGLMSGYSDVQYGDGGRDVDREYGGDIDSGDDDDEPRGRINRDDTSILERDALKWPAGEGWKML